MPNINELRRNKRGEKQVWVACIKCGKKRWVTMKNLIPRSQVCQSCSGKIQSQFIGSQKGELNRHWKGGISFFRGYYYIRLDADNFFKPMASSGCYVLVHRLNMAKYLGRCLQSWEWVHHKNGVKTDNRIENLELTTNSQHITDHNKGYKDGYKKGLIDGRGKQIQGLKEEIRLLRYELNSWQEVKEIVGLVRTL